MKIPYFILFSLFFAVFFTFTFAQTPGIMHKRLGGTNENFMATLQNPNAPIRQSNFGLPPTIYVKRAVIDSIIVLNDSSVLVVTSHKINEEFAWSNYNYDTTNGIFVCADSMVQKSLSYDSTGVWKPGRDVMVNHAVFHPNAKCSEILNALRQQYGLYHATHEVVFIGFDCSTKDAAGKKKKGEIWWLNLPFPKQPQQLLLLALVLAVLYFVSMQIQLAQKLKTA